jgi:hypothetical protein
MSKRGGPTFYFDDSWHAAHFLPALARWKQTRTQKGLADIIGSSQSEITKLKKKTQHHSTYLPQICIQLGIPMPSYNADEQERKWVELWHRARKVMTHEELELLQAQVVQRIALHENARQSLKIPLDVTPIAKPHRPPTKPKTLRPKTKVR